MSHQKNTNTANIFGRNGRKRDLCSRLHLIEHDEPEPIEDASEALMEGYETPWQETCRLAREEEQWAAEDAMDLMERERLDRLDQQDYEASQARLWA